MNHTARRRRREERRKRLGLNKKPSLDEEKDDEKKNKAESKSNYKQEKMNLSDSNFINVAILTFLAADKAFSSSMASGMIDFIVNQCR